MHSIFKSLLPISPFMDKRIARRSSLYTLVHFECPPWPANLQGEILDISESGLLVQIDPRSGPGPWQLEQTLKVSCVLPTGSLCAQAQVMRADSKTGRVGLRWIHFQNAADRSNLLAFVANGFL
ncbi:MAG: hypothetical protein A2Y02_01345 [Omnitrophica bacterium GWA2_52_12]|nr:MAG: hypothetical protein A2Y02_01345 [Omnitrophica bacterium GWA2_52_12]